MHPLYHRRTLLENDGQGEIDADLRREMHIKADIENERDEWYFGEFYDCLDGVFRGLASGTVERLYTLLKLAFSSCWSLPRTGTRTVGNR